MAPTGALLAPSVSAAAVVDPLKLSFAEPVAVTQNRAFQAAEPSIRVDAPDPTHRIWVAAPSGIGIDSRSLPAPGSENGDLFWYSDDDGRTWKFVSGPGGVGGPTMVGGGDTDVATHYGPDVYGTGLTLLNITLAASCDRGETFSFNPISNVGTVEDRQWIDTYEDRAPLGFGGPDFVLNYGGVGERRIFFHQVETPFCVPPVAGGRIDVTHPNCVFSVFDTECYQWSGNLAVDENTGDVYVTYNTFGSDDPPHNDDVVVSRCTSARSAPRDRLRRRHARPAGLLPDRHRRARPGERRLHRQPEHATRRGRPASGMDQVRPAEGRQGPTRSVRRTQRSAHAGTQQTGLK